MGILKIDSSGEPLHLSVNQVFGRTLFPTALDNTISSSHILIRWVGEHWLLKDISKNGTWLNGKKLRPLEECAIKAGDKIAFTQKGNKTLTMVNDSPLIPMLVSSLPPYKTIPITAVHSLIDSDTIECIVYQKESGDWFFETRSNCGELYEGKTLTLAGETWIFRGGEPTELTREISHGHNASLAELSVLFNVSLDLEHIRLRLEYQGQFFDLGERTHHLLTYTLARARFQAKNQGVIEAEQGWLDMESLSAMLGLDVAHTNIQIFRARKQIVQSIPHAVSPEMMIERRRGFVRWGPIAVSIKQGSSLESFTLA